MSAIVAVLLAVLVVFKDSLVAGLFPKAPIVDSVREAIGTSALEVAHVERRKMSDEEGYHFALSDVPAFSASDLAKLADVNLGGREILDRTEARGTPVNKATWQILLRGNRNQHIRVLNIVPIEVKYDVPPHGTLFWVGGQANAT